MRCNVSKEDFKSITVVHCYSDTVSIKVCFAHSNLPRWHENDLKELLTLSFIRINQSYFELGMGIATGMSYLISGSPRSPKTCWKFLLKVVIHARPPGFQWTSQPQFVPDSQSIIYHFRYIFWPDSKVRSHLLSPQAVHPMLCKTSLRFDYIHQELDIKAKGSPV